jgi:Pel9A-like, right handed beta helix region
LAIAELFKQGIFATHVHRVKRPFLIIAVVSLFSPPAFSATWFVATNGLDSNLGTSNAPFATIMRAQTAASNDDTVYLRGGTYYLNNSNFTITNNPWAIVNNITKSGISYIAYPGELPVFDFSNVKPDGWRVTAFLVTASGCVFKGFDVVGVQVTIAGTHTQSENFRVASTKANFNRFEQLRMHDGMGNGWYLTDGASNLVLNCDAYNNRGLDSGSLGNTDGFGCHPAHTSGKGNMLIGCRAWFNSDDGYDCINAFAVVTFSNCWAFYSGYFTNFTSSTGDGNGFKGGGYGVSGGSHPTPIPHHVIEHCLAVRNRASGFYANHHLDGQVWLNNTAYRNGTDYNMLCSTNNSSSAGDVPGFDQVMKNNLGYKGGTEVANLNQSASDVSYNFFTLPVTVASDDFMSLDESLLTAPRQTNGDLPYIAFAQLVSGSDLVDAGTNAGFAFAGAAPDLGAFEYGLNPPPTLAMTRAGTNLIFAGGGGPAGGMNYLVATIDLALPAAQWSRVATNQFDLLGNYAITNSIAAGLPQRFYRVRLP